MKQQEKDVVLQVMGWSVFASLLLSLLAILLTQGLAIPEDIKVFVFGLPVAAVLNFLYMKRMGRLFAKRREVRREVLRKLFKKSPYLLYRELCEKELQGEPVLEVLRTQDRIHLEGYKRHLLEQRDTSARGLVECDPSNPEYAEAFVLFNNLHRLSSWKEFFGKPDLSFSQTMQLDPPRSMA